MRQEVYQGWGPKGPLHWVIMNIDTYGRPLGEAYQVISDVSFERRLKSFDPRLKLMFDQQTKRWVILERAYDNSGWNCILKAQNKDGSERPLGEWVFNTLFVKRQNWETAAKRGAAQWVDQLKDELDRKNEKSRRSLSDDNQALLREDVMQWRKAARELHNLPTSDVTAGYRKV